MHWSIGTGGEWNAFGLECGLWEETTWACRLSGVDAWGLGDACLVFLLPAFLLRFDVTEHASLICRSGAKN